MKILLNATNIGKKLSGLNIYTLSIIKELARLDNDNEYLIVLNLTGFEMLKDIAFSSNFKFKVTRSNMSSDRGFWGHIVRLIYSNYLALKYRHYLIFSASQLEAVIVPCKQIVVVQDVIHLMDKHFNKKQYFFFKYYLSEAVRKAIYVIVPSQFTKTQIIKYYGIAEDKIVVTLLGVQQIYWDRLNNQTAGRGGYLLYIGRIAETKNIENLLRAFKRIQSKTDCKMVIAGNGSRDYIASLQVKGLIDERVKISSNLDSKDLLALYASASLFVFPTLYEGFGLPPLEAMACGCPVVVSNTTSLPEICGDAAVYVDPKDVRSIENGILEVLKNEKLREELIKKGFERVKKFRWENTVKQTLEVISKVDK